ncbi:outer membrane protein assembly factor [Candidatus Cloacimonadota bacterium]
MILVILVFICLLSAQEDFRIGKIRFEGNNTISDSRLLKNMSLKPKSFVQKILFWTKGPEYIDVYLDSDIQQIIADHQKEGFLNTKVTVKKNINESGKKVDLIFMISENDPVLIGDVNLILTSSIGSVNDSTRSLLTADSTKWSIKPNVRFRDVNIFNMKKIFSNLLLNNGFPSPEISHDITLDTSGKYADVTYQIDPGKLCRFGEIKITGNDRTPSKVIMKQVSFNGDQFSQTQLQETQRRVQQLGVFQFVTMKSLLDQIESDRLPVEILVKELPEWSFKFGVGYGLEDRFRASIDLLKLNFLGGARRANLNLKHSFLEPYNISLKITQPAFLGPYGSLTFKPFLKEENETSYNLESFGTSLTYQNLITPYLNGFISYRFERSFIDLIDEDEGDLYNEYYNKSAISQGLSFDNSYPAFYPDKGFAASYIATLSGLKLNSQYHYLQGLVDIRKFNQIYTDLVLAGKMKIGSMKPIWRDEITPVEERFYAGGSSSIRGWGRSDIGPKNENGNPEGGNSYLEFSLEARQRVYGLLYLVLFFDAGNVWTDYNAYDLNDLKYSPGIGLRFKTPIGPIRLDAAQPIWDKSKRIQLHLSIGQAF